jgi:chemotaxis protein histidine kinase CheA
LLANFQTVVSDGLKSAETAADGKGDNHIVTLPVEALIDLLKDDKLKIDEEILIVKLITSYIKYRDAIKPLLDEEDPANDEQVIKQLTEEEKKAREDAKAAKAEEEKKAKEGEAAKEAERVAAMDDLGKIQYGSDLA